MHEIENDKIGEYLKTLITEKYVSQRKFCEAYIKATGGNVNNDETRKMANRLSQIIKGAKAIQIYDLPIFTELLDATCEEILSAGQYFVPKSNRVTNYSVAFSKSKNDWVSYIEREDKLILNPDEYGNTVIDYALQFRNYEFLKFLMDNQYIWFDSRKDNEYIMTFGAGTSIKRREPHNIDSYLEYKIYTEDELRINMICLAIENNDRKMLDDLRAREITEMYYSAHYLRCALPDFDTRYDENLVRHISKASDEILDYFTDEFEIRDTIKYKDGSKRSHTFMFPFISQVLDLIIEGNHSFTEFALKKSIEHNQRTYDTLNQLIEKSIKTNKEPYNYRSNEHLKTIEPDIIKGVMRWLDFSENGNIVSFCDMVNVSGIITNVAHTVKASSNVKINHLIEELNGLYSKIRNIKA